MVWSPVLRGFSLFRFSAGFNDVDPLQAIRGLSVRLPFFLIPDILVYPRVRTNLQLTNEFADE